MNIINFLASPAVAFSPFGKNDKSSVGDVDRSNMSKLDESGKPIYREDGKILKGPRYSPPNLEGMVLDAVAKFKTL